MIKVFILTALFPLGVFAQGSTTVGDGGNGVVCKTSGIEQGQAQHYRYTLQLLDLYEARNVHGHIFHDKPIIGRDWMSTETTSRVCGILYRARLRLQNVMPLNSKVIQAFKQACELSSRVRIRVEIPQTHDYGRVVVDLPKSCRLVQLGFRQPSGEIWIARNESEYLSHIDLAALLLHESLHPVFARKSDKLALRQFVAFNFSTRGFQKRNLDLATALLEHRQPVTFRK